MFYQNAMKRLFSNSALILTVMLLFIVSPIAYAQTDEAQLTEAPDFTTTSLEAEIAEVEDAEQLTEEQQGQVKSYLETAIASLSGAAKNLENRARFQTELENSPETVLELRNSVGEIQQELTREPEKIPEPMREETLLKLEQDLIAKESDLRALRSELEGYETGLQDIAARQLTAPKELNEARSKIGDITTSLITLGEGELDAVARANRKSLQARRYFRRTQITALEQEIAGLSKRQEIVSLRSTLVDLNLQKLTSEVQYLSEKTGQRRLNEAAQLEEDAKMRLGAYADMHPIVTELAERNILLTEEIVKLASSAADISKRSAATRSSLDIVESDLRVAEELIDNGDLDRRAGATLRRLSNQLTPVNVLKANIRKTRDLRVDVTQEGLIAQESLREIPFGRVDTDALLTEARILRPDLAEFTAADKEALQNLKIERRELLQRVITAASSRRSEIANLAQQQEALLESSNKLEVMLDEKLLWVPSVPAIDFEWPAKVGKGVFTVFSPRNIALTFDVFISQLQRYWFLAIMFFLAILTCIYVRKGLWEDILDRAQKVGRVQKDNYWHTPSVILSCIIVALPFPLLFMMFWLIFESSSSPEPFIAGLADTFLYVSLFSLFLLTWRAWDRDKSLFAAHYKLPAGFRKSVNKEFRWFIPLAGLFTGLIILTSSSTDPDVYEGFSVFAFVVTAVALSYFGFKVLWNRRDVLSSQFAEDSFFRKHRNPLTFIVVALPMVAGGLALYGYYDTASQLLGRLFFSAWLFLLTYVVQGLIKRTVLVAQRQLAFRQAIEKRDAAAKARAEKLEAEERGEEVAPPPPVDTSEIDVKAMSRQSSQLLNTVVVLVFAALMWVIWSDLLPALSIFNEVKIGSYTGQILDDTGVMKDIAVPITLWNLIQFFVILALTFIAAKNLPGFLEIFVLNRAGIEAGSRYAITTILGYIIIAVGVIIGFDKLGLQWSQLRWIVTGLSVGIGLGLQKIIANFVSGLIILFERPVRIGDYVTIGEQSGTVSRIQIRATTLADLENREILIPNEALISERVTNWTLSNSVTRVTVPVGIAYGSDTDKARELMLASLKQNTKILETPAPQVLFLGFGDSSLDFEIRAFLRNFEDRVPVRHMIHTDINKVLEEAGISIPFPQRDLNIVSQNMPLNISSASSKPSKTGKKPQN